MKKISNDKEEILANNTTKNGLWQKTSTNHPYQNSNTIPLTPPKSSTPITKEQKLVDYMKEQQSKSLNNSKLSNQETSLDKKLSNFLERQWKAPKRLTVHAWVQGRQYDTDEKNMPAKHFEFQQVFNMWRQNKEANDKILVQNSSKNTMWPTIWAEFSKQPSQALPVEMVVCNLVQQWGRGYNRQGGTKKLFWRMGTWEPNVPQRLHPQHTTIWCPKVPQQQQQ